MNLLKIFGLDYDRICWMTNCLDQKVAKPEFLEKLQIFYQVCENMRKSNVDFLSNMPEFQAGPAPLYKLKRNVEK